jgi:hypothetical protein
VTGGVGEKFDELGRIGEAVEVQRIVLRQPPKQHVLSGLPDDLICDEDSFHAHGVTRGSLMDGCDGHPPGTCIELPSDNLGRHRCFHMRRQANAACARELGHPPYVMIQYFFDYNGARENHISKKIRFTLF